MPKDKKPNITWMEGLLTLFNAQFPHGPNDPRWRGFSLGRQIIGSYIAEMLIKYALEDSGRTYGPHHNLYELFRNLPRPLRCEVERTYTAILNSLMESAWDIAKSVESLLQYLGPNPIKDTRYFWEPNRNHVHIFEHTSILIMPETIHCLIYALFIALHNYPNKPIVKRYNTVFMSLAEALERDQQRAEGA